MHHQPHLLLQDGLDRGEEHEPHVVEELRLRLVPGVLLAKDGQVGAVHGGLVQLVNNLKKQDGSI